MFWYLIFCAAGYKGGMGCQLPQPMPDKEICAFVGSKMAQTAQEVNRSTAYRCISIRKKLAR